MFFFCCSEEYEKSDDENEENIAQAIIIDAGSRLCRAGFVGDESPTAVFTTVVGKPRLDLPMDSADLDGLEDRYFGEDALLKSGLLTLYYPVDRGVVENWDMMEDIWHHTFYNVLSIDPSEHFMLLTEVPLSPKATRERTAEIMFETFHVLGIYVTSAAVLALYSSGIVTGCVLDCGDVSAYSIAIYEGYPIPHALERLYLGGRDVTKCFMRMMNTERNAELLEKSDFEAVHTWKEEVCYVALDFEKEMEIESSSSLHKTLLLPTKPEKPFVVGSERFRAPEILFTPAFSNDRSEGLGVHNLVVKTITTCAIDIRKNLYDNIVVCGGATLMTGFVERLEKEIALIAPELVSVTIEAPDNRGHSSWTGGAVLTQLAAFQEHWVTWSDYRDSGAEAVYRCDQR